MNRGFRQGQRAYQGFQSSGGFYQFRAAQNMQQFSTMNNQFKMMQMQ